MSGERKAPRQLMSWKEIADYLQVAVRTAQTWEHEKGLPVRRMPGEKGRVSADPVELDRWKQSVSHSGHWFSNPVYLKIYAALATALLIAAAAYESSHYWGQSPQAPPASIRLKGVTSAITGRQGNGRSRMTLPETVIQTGGSDTVSALHRKISFADIDNDGELETILDYSPVHLRPSPDQLNRKANCGEESPELRPKSARSAESQNPPLTGKIKDSPIVLPESKDEGRRFKLACQLPMPFATLLTAAPVPKKKAITDLSGNKHGPVADTAEPHCAHCEKVHSPSPRHGHS